MPANIVVATLMRPGDGTGVQTHVAQLIDFLSQMQIQARHVTPYSDFQWWMYPIFAVRLLIAVASGPASVWWYRHWHAVALERALKSSLVGMDSGVIYAQCPVSARVALRAREGTRFKVVLAVHYYLSQAKEWADKGVLTLDGRLYRSIEALEREVLSAVDGIVFVSGFMRSALVTAHPGLTRVPIRVIHNFVDSPTEVEASGLPTDGGDLICIGSMEPNKNQAYALEIVAAARALGRVLRLTLVGGGPDLERIRARIRSLDLENTVIATGYIRNAARLIWGHRAYLHVAKIENLPLVLLEALARSKPVFAPAVGGIPEVFSDGAEGRLIPLDDPIAAARRILEVLDSKDAMHCAAELARKRFDAVFSASRVAPQLLQFLHEVSAGLQPQYENADVAR